MSDKVLLSISIFIALALWIYVFTEESRETTINVPVTVSHEDDGTMVFINPKEVSVRVSGPDGFITKALSNASLNVDLSELPVGNSYVQLSSKEVKAVGLEVINIVPSVVEVKIVKTVNKRLPVKPLILDEPPRGYKITSVKVVPEYVTVEGSYAALSLLDSIQTENVEVYTLISNRVFLVGFADYDGVKDINPDEVSVNIEVSEDIITETYDMQLVCSKGENDNISNLPSVSLTVKGRRDLVDQIGTYQNLATINCEHLTSGAQIPVNVDNVEGVAITVSPKIITIE